MSRDAFDTLLYEFAQRFRQVVREIVAEEIEPLRYVLMRPACEDAPELTELVDAGEIARLLGEDTSTERKKRAAVQKVYDLARRDLIPYVRLSPRRVRFDPAAVKKCLASGGLAKPFSRGRDRDVRK